MRKRPECSLGHRGDEVYSSLNCQKIPVTLLHNTLYAASSCLDYIRKFALMLLSQSSAFVSPQWLFEAMSKGAVSVVDASWHMPASGRSGRDEFTAQHIEGAVFFDIDAIADQSTDLPHMLPSAEQFSRQASELGLSHDQPIVVYDVLGLFSAPRVWWMLRIFGAREVYILEGGLPAWIEAGYPVTSDTAQPPQGHFVVHYNAEAVADKTAIEIYSRNGGRQIVDARSVERFAGTAPEPRPGLRSGRIPNSCNLPFGTLLANGRLKDTEALRKWFTDAGVDLAQPVVTTCGSGVSAAILLVALHELGVGDVTLYDGSWAEWGRV